MPLRNRTFVLFRRHRLPPPPQKVNRSAQTFFTDFLPEGEKWDRGSGACCTPDPLKQKIYKGFTVHGLTPPVLDIIVLSSMILGGNAMGKRVAWGILGLAAAGAGAAGGVTAVGNHLYNQVMIPKVRDPQLMEPNSIQAEGRVWARSAAGFRSAAIRSVDGLRLWAAMVPAPQESHRWAICMHGYYDTYEAMGAIGLHYHQAGWNVLMPDQRGHGKSEGDYVGWGYDERLDLLGWINYVVRRDPDAEIVLHGVSMGGATVLMVTGGVLPRQVKAAVSDCAYTSIEAQMCHIAPSFVKHALPFPVPVSALFSALRRTTQRRAGYDLRDVVPVEAVTRSRTPTLFIHGVEDDFVPSEMMNKLYQAARCPKSFLWMPDAGHALSVGTHPDLYWTAVDTFLGEHLTHMG